MIRLIALLGVAWTLAIAPGQRADVSQVVAALETYRQLAVAMDAERIADAFDPQGEVSHNDGMPVTGRTAIVGLFKSFTGYKIESYELRGTSTAINGSSATQDGAYAQVVRAPDGGVINAAGRFTAEWRRQSDGRWLLHRMHTVSEL